MKKYLIYNNVVRGAGLGHTMCCYNYAVQMAINQNCELIVPRLVLGHNLGNNFEFETFFGLDRFDENKIKELMLLNKDNIELIEYNSLNPCSGSFLKSKIFFYEKYLTAQKTNFTKYKNHNNPNKTNISIHIRRGDIVRNKSKAIYYNSRILPDLWFKQSLDSLLRLKDLKSKDININIYSETQPNGIYHNENAEPFDLKKIFSMSNCCFYFNVDMYECMHNLINSDLFIGGRCYGIPILVSFYRELFKKESYLDRSNSVFISENKFSLSKVID